MNNIVYYYYLYYILYFELNHEFVNIFNNLST